MTATRSIVLGMVGVLALSACTPTGGGDSVATAITPLPSASPSVTPYATASDKTALSAQDDAAVLSPDIPSAEQLSAQASAPKLAQASAPGSAQTKVIYLTFDDGPWNIYTTQILDILEESNAKATFFVVGNMAKQHPKLIKRIARDGHAIGNHTWSHADLTKLSDSGVERELTDTGEQVGDAMGPCLRPPYGAKNKRVVRISKSLGYKPVMWTTHVADWDQPPVKTMISGMKSATKPKLNLLLHDGGGDRPNTVEAVRRMIPKWQADGYTLESLPACRI